MIIIQPYLKNLLPLGGQPIDPQELNIFKWTFADPNVSHIQTSYYLEWKEAVVGSQLNNTNWINSSQTQHSFPINTFNIGKTYAWRVKVKDNSPIINLLSAEQSDFEVSNISQIGWTKGNNSNVTLTLNNDLYHVLNGTKSIQTVSPNITNIETLTCVKFVSPNSYYAFSAYSKVLNSQNPKTAAILIVNQKDSNGNILSTHSTSGTTSTGGSFVRQEIGFYTSPNTTSVELILKQNADGTIYWDCIQFEKSFYATTWSIGGSSGIESNFSEWVLFKTTARPSCSITFPQKDNDNITSDIATFTHSYSDLTGQLQTSYQYRLYNDSDLLLWTSDLFKDQNNLVVLPKGLLQQSTYYKVDVTVTDSDGLSNTSIKRRFYTNFPTSLSNTTYFQVTPDNENSKLDLKWSNSKSNIGNYQGSGTRYKAAKFGNGIEVSEIGEKVYWDINIPEYFTICGWVKLN